MSPKNTLPNGFITVEEAIKLIQSDTRENPVVDMDWLIAHKVWLDRNGPAHNFRIPKQRMLSPSEVYRTKRGNVIEYEHTGDVYVYISSPLENELLKDAIMKKYEELVGHEYREFSVRGMSTVADDAQGSSAVTPRARKPKAQAGETISSRGIEVSNSADLEV